MAGAAEDAGDGAVSALSMATRKAKADRVLAMRREGKNLWQITKEMKVNERQLIQVLDAFRLLGVDTAPVKQEVML